MLSTAFEEVGGGTEYSVCGDVVGSRVIERLMSQAIEHGMPELVVEHYCALLTPERYWNIFGDKYGSHVAQTLFDLLRRVLAAQGERRLGDALRHRVVQRTLELAAAVRPQWLEMLADTYASHVGRALIKLLAGYAGERGIRAFAAVRGGLWAGGGELRGAGRDDHTQGRKGWVSTPAAASPARSSRRRSSRRGRSRGRPHRRASWCTRAGTGRWRRRCPRCARPWWTLPPAPAAARCASCASAPPRCRCCSCCCGCSHSAAPAAWPGACCAGAAAAAAASKRAMPAPSRWRRCWPTRRAPICSRRRSRWCRTRSTTSSTPSASAAGCSRSP
jgi:hypothetical protein